MSLLLDALKRAERQKKEFPLPERPVKQAENPGVGAGLSLILEPPEPRLQPEMPTVRQPPTIPDIIPAIALEAPLPQPALSEPAPQPMPDEETPVTPPAVAPVTPLPSDLPTAAPAKAPAPAPASPTAPIESAQASTSAAHGSSEPRQKSQKILKALAKQPDPKAARRKRLMALGGLTVAIALCTLGGLVWLDRSQIPASILAQTPPPALAPQGADAPQPGDNGAMPPSPPETPAPFAPSQVSAPAAPVVEPPPAALAGAPKAPEAAPPPRRGDIQITVHPATAAGYRALSEGNLDRARPRYEQALENNPRDRDAQLGLASIALKTGNTGEAVRWYERLLTDDPRDPDANAGLALLRAPGNPAYYESRLRQLTDELGQSSPAVLFALGTVHAMQSHWVEAQEVFFQLVTQNPRMPNYLFNLAVSLDHLGKYALARDYYRQALETSEKRDGGFDRNAVTERLITLDESSK